MESLELTSCCILCGNGKKFSEILTNLLFGLVASNVYNMYSTYLKESNTYLKERVIFSNNEFRLGFVLTVDDIHMQSPFL